ncbi:SRPBCC family protein [Umezawaea tangerina]|uniref:Carbon monoxide dehydrogenase subunit G n=1 Tax=Umezawaea tangerina TaxID=84725 RepID=A0A2T0TL71_9PSEU|nr:SRPBCC family protein [Umezawaea tangerina]PRY46385.1 carbon monoxide dehydrogenase subunit G [Umezawaea tangerina]
MKLEHEFTVPAPVGTVWTALLDPERVAPCMPGATLTEVDGARFTGTVKVKLGPITLMYKGSGEFLETDEASRRMVMKASGKDVRGNGTAAATVTATLVEADGGTRALVVTDLSITGRPAQFGRGLIAEVGGRIIDQFAECLAGSLGTEDAGGPTAADPPDGGTEVTQQHLKAVPDRAEEVEAIDLLGTAGVPVLKRALPLVAGLAVAVLVVSRLRRHR